jgi:signal transduction histidine kinase
MMVFSLQATVIGLTGAGVSPVLVALIPSSFATGMLLREEGWPLIAVPLSTVIVAMGGTYVGMFDDLIPTAFLVEVPLPLSVSVLLFLSVAMVVSFRFGAEVAASLSERTVEMLDAKEQTISLLQDHQGEMLAFAAGVAHDLKGPLTAVQGLATALARQPVDERVDLRHQMLVVQTHRLQEAVSDLLDIYRPVQPSCLVDVDLVSFLCECLEMSSGLAEQCEVAVLFDCALGELEARLDPRKMRAAITSVLHNAIEASAPTGSVVVRLQRSAAAIVIQIDDTGPGIPETHLDRLFAPGFTTKSTGNGLGLFTARFVVEQHGGSVTLETRGDGGARGEIRLECV